MLTFWWVELHCVWNVIHCIPKLFPPPSIFAWHLRANTGTRTSPGPSPGHFFDQWLVLFLGLVPFLIPVLVWVLVTNIIPSSFWYRSRSWIKEGPGPASCWFMVPSLLTVWCWFKYMFLAHSALRSPLKAMWVWPKIFVAYKLTLHLLCID